MVADRDLVAGLRAGPPQRAREPEPVDLGGERDRALGRLDVVTRDGVLDLATGDAQDARRRAAAARRARRACGR